MAKGLRSLTALSFAVFLNIDAAQAVEVYAPCADPANPQTGSHLRTCTEYFQGTSAAPQACQTAPGSTPGSGYGPVLKRDLGCMVKTHIDGLYRGERLDTSPTQGQNLYFPKPVCNYATGEFTTNKNGESCGDFIRIGINFSTTLGIITGINSIKFTFDTTPPKQFGIKEFAWRAGGLTQALSCYGEQVKNEIINTKKLQISPGCQSYANNVAQISNAADIVAKSINSQLKSQANVQDIWNCENGYDPNASTNPDVGKLRQSAQQLCSARAGLEAAFIQLAVCETLVRAETSYLASDLGDALKLKNAMQNTIAPMIQSDCRGTYMSAGPPTRCANQSYAKHVDQDFFKPILNKWPSNGSCQ